MKSEHLRSALLDVGLEVSDDQISILARRNLDASDNHWKFGDFVECVFKLLNVYGGFSLGTR